MRRRLGASLFGAVLLAAGFAAGQAPQPPEFDPKSTAQPEQYLPGPFRLYTVNGERQYKMHCPVCERYLNPSVGVFVNLEPKKPEGGAFNWLSGLDPQVTELLKGLEALATERTADKFGAFAAFLSLKKDILTDDNRDEVKSELEAFGKQFKLNRLMLGLAPLNDPQTSAYGIKSTATVTVLVYDRLQVKSRHEFGPENPMTAEKVKQVLTEAANMLPSVQAEQRNPKKVKK
jgi:hypothetical protein